MTKRRDWRERFHEKVDRSGDCWLWTAASDHGYGAFVMRHGDTRRAHRVAWEMTNGPIPPGLFVCHHCDNPPCVNPAHLFLGTNADNLADMRAKGRNARGERHGRRKLSRYQVELIRKFVWEGTPQRVVAQMLGVSEATISLIVNGKRWVA